MATNGELQGWSKGWTHHTKRAMHLTLWALAVGSLGVLLAFNPAERATAGVFVVAAGVIAYARQGHLEKAAWYKLLINSEARDRGEPAPLS